MLKNQKISFMFIVISGEAIFMLPFLIPRLYRPLLLETWGLTNTDIGAAFSAYGFSAMISYIIGGQFADKFHPRKLISISLCITALSSLFLILYPSASVLIGTYFFYGISTILLMWGALIKVTHVSGHQDKRSTAMGILDGGRGLVAAIMSSVLIYLVSNFYPDLSTTSSKEGAVLLIFSIMSAFTLFIGLGIWILLKDFKSSNDEDHSWSIEVAKELLKDKRIWLLGFVILSAYAGYKSIDNYSTYLVDVHGRSLTESSVFTSMIFWLRPVSALAAGFFADKLYQTNKTARFKVLTLLLFISSALQFLLATNSLSEFNLIFATVLLSSVFAYALRSIYFSIFGDLKIKDYAVGTTVGIVSLVGFMPDMFFGIITGNLIDTYPGAQGFSYSFLFTGALLFLGCIASYFIYSHDENKNL